MQVGGIRRDNLLFPTPFAALSCIWYLYRVLSIKYLRFYYYHPCRNLCWWSINLRWYHAPTWGLSALIWFLIYEKFKDTKRDNQQT